MNIKEAKEEIMHAVKAYTAKDETGAYLIPPEKQRPILLIGPPGIGKTAIMEQVARECGIGLVSYTITHHTRQSAIGLPFISKKNYGGAEYSVTEYTMSEIVASVYDQIERSGVQEGILFLDEINCVSETLAPTMLQFLQYKTFGSHKVPDGFIIVTAGNPPQYNKSVRDFDIVTLDRVRKIEIEEDFSVWKEYAYKNAVQGVILSYLEIRKQNFYAIRTEVEEKYFVTARGWEDLSKIIEVSEKVNLPVNEALVRQYIQDPEIASDFASYYDLYQKYREIYRVPDILNGMAIDTAKSLSAAPFDEKLSLIGLLIDTLGGEFRDYATNLAVQEELLQVLGPVKERVGNRIGVWDAIHDARENAVRNLERARAAKMIGREEEHTKGLVILALSELEQSLGAEADFGEVQQYFAGREEKRQEAIDETDRHLTNSFSFMAKTFGEGQEMVIFLSELTAGFYSLKFIGDCGNESYYKYNKLLLLKDRQQELRESILSLQED